MYNNYKKYLITLISFIIVILFFFIIYRSYKISKIKQNITNLPVIRSDVEIVKIKKDNRELKEPEVNSFYKDENMNEKVLEKQNLDTTINNIVATTITDTIKQETLQDNKTIDDIIEKEDIQKKQEDVVIDKNIKKLIVNEKQDDEIIEENTIKENSNFYKAQLIALKNQQQAKNFIDQTKKNYVSILKNLDVFMVKIDLKEKGIFYRVQVGNFNTKEDANNFCKEYIKLGNKNITNCIVIK